MTAPSESVRLSPALVQLARSVAKSRGMTLAAVIEWAALDRLAVYSEGHIAGLQDARSVISREGQRRKAGSS